MAMIWKPKKSRPEADAGEARTLDPQGESERVFKSGVVKLPDGSLVNVVITALDASGAQIEFGERQVLPTQLVLFEPSSRLRAPVRVLWQQDGRAALGFLE
jgi:hypothetical protein